MKPPTSDPTLLPIEYSGLKRPKPQLTLKNPVQILMIGLLISLISLSPVYILIKYWRLCHEDETSVAVIEQIKMNDRGLTCNVAYTFKAPSNNGGLIDYHYSGSVSYNLCQSLTIGQNINILYVRSNPNYSVIMSEFAPPLGIMIFVGAFGTSGILLIGFSLNDLSNLRKLRKSGQQAQAILFDHWRSLDIFASRGDRLVCLYFVAYAFKVPTRQGLRIITSAEKNKVVYENCRIGDTLTVSYLPEKPSKVCRLMPYSFSRPLREEDFLSNFNKVTNHLHRNGAIIRKLLFPFNKYPYQ